ncbi:MAG: hypothetical protein ABSD71_14275 [Bacteroidales bacterium]|jgi:hypothetical protein
MKPYRITEFEHYLKEHLCPIVLERYKTFQILSEADLQSHVWQILFDYFSNDVKTKNMVRVLNKPFLKKIGIHPDIVIFRRKKPWIIIELKEWWRNPNKGAAIKDFGRMINAIKHFSAKPYKIQRVYFLYVSRLKAGNLLDETYKSELHYNPEVPIVLQGTINASELKKWEIKFPQWAKYDTKPKNISKQP